MDLNRRRLVFIFLILGVCAVAFLSRFAGAEPNFTGIAAMFVFLGMVRREVRWAPWAGFAVLIASDALLGLYNPWVMLSVYASYALMIGSASFLSRPRFAVAGGVLTLGLGTIVFFLVTNFAVWAAQDIYPATWAGLLMSYEFALPFLRGSVEGAAAYGAAFFLAFALANRVGISVRRRSAIA